MQSSRMLRQTSLSITLLVAVLTFLALVAIIDFPGAGAAPPAPAQSSFSSSSKPEDPEEMGACFTRMEPDACMRTKRKECEPTEPFFPGAICSKESYSECDSGVTKWEIAITKFMLCSTRMMSDMTIEHEKEANKALIQYCEHLGAYPGQCVLDGTYEGPYLSGFRWNDEMDTCTFTSEAWFRCVRSY